MPGSRRSWHVGGGTCQDRGEVGMLEAEHARIAAKLACWRRNMPGSRRSWHVGGGTCQDRGEAGMLEAEPASIAAKLACWRRNMPASRRSWHVGGGNVGTINECVQVASPEMASRYGCYVNLRKCRGSISVRNCPAHSQKLPGAQRCLLTIAAS